MSSVKVAVRVRPFNQREKDMNSRCILDMQGQMTKITDPQSGKERKFFFDFSYWSHDGYKEDSNGLLMKDTSSSKYDDQRTVFVDLGQEVLDNAFEGYHTCLFAYGQTGSGKSYSIVGYGPNKGIIPMVCEEIFERINSKKEVAGGGRTEFDVKLSMLEIYNEHVQDLFQNPNIRPKGGLKVREHPKLGVFVEELSKVTVHSYDEIQRQIDKGTGNRTIGATNMNATSSRAHTVVTMAFVQKFFDPTGKPLNQKESHINLVDLAGSERAGSTGASGSRLQEGSNINKSLSCLGKVISTLAEKSSGKRKDIVVPYRDSKLTRILQNALGGNSKTTMIAALSPASVNFDETLGTLRYADQVKAIKNVAIINESPQEKLIRELKEENEKLKQMMLAGGVLPGSGGNTEDLEKAKKEYEEMLENNKQAMIELEKNWEQKLKAAKIDEQEEEWRTVPHIMNLNEDPFLSGKIRNVFKAGTNVIGRNDKSNPPDLIIGGLGIVKQHCKITYDPSSREITLLPNTDSEHAKLHVNGNLISSSTPLQHEDRILFGNHNYYIFVDPQKPLNEEMDWEYASHEVHKDQIEAVQGDQDEETKKKLKELEEALALEKANAEERLKEQMAVMEEQRIKMEEEMKDKEKQMREELGANTGSEEYKAKLKEMQETLENQKQEAETSLKSQEDKLKKEAKVEDDKQKRKLQNEEFRIRQQKYLEEKLGQAIPKINEVTEICLQMGRLNYMYTPYLTTDIKDGEKISKVCVKVYPDQNQDFFNLLDFEEFTEKYYLIKEKFENYMYDLDNATNIADVEDDTEDDPNVFGIGIRNEHQLIGQAHIYLDSLANLLETTNDQTPLIDNRGASNGELKYSVIPKLYENGNEQNLLMFDNVEELEGKNLEVTVKIMSARGLPPKLANEVYCKYTWIDEDAEEFESTKCSKKSSSPEFNYERAHELFLTKYLIDHLWESALVVSLFGKMSEENIEKLANKIGGTVKNQAIKDGMTVTPERSMLNGTGQPTGTDGFSFSGAQTNKKETPEERIRRMDKEIEALKKKNVELKKQAEQTHGSNCCIIF